MGNCFYHQLRYICPANGGWGMVRIAMLVPESYQLFISPAACGRHGALGAINHGIKHRLSYYFVEEEDIVQGYDNLIFDAVDTLLGRLAAKNIRPRVLTLFVTCIDDLVGTDTEAVAWELEQKYPGIYFIVCHMNPIKDNGKEPPMVAIHKSIYPLLYREEPEKRDRGINCLGNLEKLSEACEIHELVASLSAGPLRHISQYETFDAFLEMGGSLCNFVFAAPAAAAAKALEKNCGQPMVEMTVHTDPQRIRQRYEQMAERLSEYTGTAAPEKFAGRLNYYEAKTEELAEKTKASLRGCRIAVDDFASPNPFETALYLLRKGFAVTWVVYKEVGGQALEDKKRLEREYPQVEQLCSLDYRMPRRIFEAAGEERPGNEKARKDAEGPRPGNEKDWKDAEGPRSGNEKALLAVGLEAAYVLGADYVADVACEEGLFGYQGLQEMFHRMQNAYGKAADLHTLIEEHGLVV